MLVSDSAFMKIAGEIFLCVSNSKATVSKRSTPLKSTVSTCRLNEVTVRTNHKPSAVFIRHTHFSLAGAHSVAGYLVVKSSST